MKGRNMNKKHGQIFLIFLAYYGMTCVSNAYFLFGPFYEGLGAAPQRAGLFLSVFYMVTLFCRPLGSMVTERLDIRWTLIGSSLLCAASAAGIALTLRGGVVLLVFRALSGVFFSIFIVATVAAQSVLLDEKERGAGFALFTTGSMLPLATVVPFCEWLIDGGHAALYVWTPVALSLICAAVSLQVKNLNYAGASKSRWGSYGGLFGVKGFSMLLFTVIIMSFADAGTLTAASLAEERGVSVSYFMAAATFSAVIIRTLGFNLVAKAPRIAIAAPSVAIMGFALFGLAFSSSAALFAFFGILYGLGVGIAYPAMLSLVGDLMPQQYRPKAAGLILLVLDVGWIISPLMYGCLSPLLGASSTYRFNGLLVFAAATAVHMMYWRKFLTGAAAPRS